MEQITVPAYAKINPSLDVTGVREDGYHTVRMLLQQIGLHDLIRLEKVPEPGVKLRIIRPADHAAALMRAADPEESSSAGAARNVSGACGGDDDALLPADGTNLACRAARLLIDTGSVREGVSITLEKHIPVAAGLAGGSTDAAAVLCGMNELFGLGLSTDELCRLALPLGADIPFCILGGCALAEGIGEILSPLRPIPRCQILLVKPPQGISTGAVYRALDEIPSPVHPDIDAALAASAAGDLHALCAVMGNILEEVTLPMLPRLSRIRSDLLSCGAAGAMMSGSGPTMFGLFEDPRTARKASECISAAYPDCRVVLTSPLRSRP